ncbi:MAG: GrpB family protein [Parachlamydiales bacterium]|nr:GrpB family protein [Parachlamydiales bacterium]
MVEIVEYDPNWPKLFEKEKEPIKKALKNNFLDIFHIGSTAVFGLCSKPKIDILVVVKDISLIDVKALEKLGYENRGEVIKTGRYFSKKNPKIHLHIFEKNNPNIERNLKFRDYLRSHEDARKEYAALKKELAYLLNDGMKYCWAKTEFIERILKKAGFSQSKTKA